MHSSLHLAIQSNIIKETLSILRDGEQLQTIMNPKLIRIQELSRNDPHMVFTSLGHLINEDFLRECHANMDPDKAVGIDNITKADYEKNLEANLKDLVERLKKHAYKPRPARKVEIPKDNGKMRTLSIYCYEDKLIQEALRQILEAIFEPLFSDSMMGFRPQRSCHMALKRLTFMIEKRPTNYVVDADIKGFFDNLDHEKIMFFIGRKIKDPNICRLIRRMLKAGIMNGTEFEETLLGSGQGSVTSPVIANIYMHCVVAWWFENRVKPTLKGYADIVIYADYAEVKTMPKNYLKYSVYVDFQLKTSA